MKINPIVLIAITVSTIIIVSLVWFYLSTSSSVGTQIIQTLSPQKRTIHYSIQPIGEDFKGDVHKKTVVSVIASKTTNVIGMEGQIFNLLLDNGTTLTALAAPDIIFDTNFSKKDLDGKNVTLETLYQNYTITCGYIADFGDGFKGKYPMQNFSINNIIKNIVNFTIIHDKDDCNKKSELKQEYDYPLIVGNFTHVNMTYLTEGTNR